jgi:hypothetical protein
MGTTGAAIYNPATGLPSIVDTNEFSYQATTVASGNATTAGTSTIVVTSATGLVVDQFVQVDANGVNAEILQIVNIASNTLTVWPPTAHNHAALAPVVSKVARQVITIGDPTTPGYQAGVDALGNLKVNVTVGGVTSIRLSSTFTRPANTTAYAPGALVANSTTAGSVVPLAWTNAVEVAGLSLQVLRARIVTSSTSLANASFMVHLFEASPTVSVGDGAAFDAAGVMSLSGISSYGGFIPVNVLQAGSDGAIGFGAVGNVGGLTLLPAATTVYGLVECSGAYTPTSAETITVIIEGTNA